MEIISQSNSVEPLTEQERINYAERVSDKDNRKLLRRFMFREKFSDFSDDLDDFSETMNDEQWEKALLTIVEEIPIIPENLAPAERKFLESVYSSLNERQLEIVRGINDLNKLPSTPNEATADVAGLAKLVTSLRKKDGMVSQMFEYLNDLRSYQLYINEDFDAVAPVIFGPASIIAESINEEENENNRERLQQTRELQFKDSILPSVKQRGGIGAMVFAESLEPFISGEQKFNAESIPITSDEWDEMLRVLGCSVDQFLKADNVPVHVRLALSQFEANRKKTVNNLMRVVNSYIALRKGASLQGDKRKKFTDLHASLLNQIAQLVDQRRSIDVLLEVPPSKRTTVPEELLERLTLSTREEALINTFSPTFLYQYSLLREAGINTDKIKPESVSAQASSILKQSVKRNMDMRFAIQYANVVADNREKPGKERATATEKVCISFLESCDMQEHIADEQYILGARIVLGSLAKKSGMMTGYAERIGTTVKELSITEALDISVGSGFLGRIADAIANEGDVSLRELQSLMDSFKQEMMEGADIPRVFYQLSDFARQRNTISYQKLTDEQRLEHDQDVRTIIEVLAEQEYRGVLITENIQQNLASSKLQPRQIVMVDRMVDSVTSAESIDICTDTLKELSDVMLFDYTRDDLHAIVSDILSREAEKPMTLGEVAKLYYLIHSDARGFPLFFSLLHLLRRHGYVNDASQIARQFRARMKKEVFLSGGQISQLAEKLKLSTEQQRELGDLSEYLGDTLYTATERTWWDYLNDLWVNPDEHIADFVTLALISVSGGEALRQGFFVRPKLRAIRRFVDGTDYALLRRQLGIPDTVSNAEIGRMQTLLRGKLDRYNALWSEEGALGKWWKGRSIRVEAYNILQGIKGSDLQKFERALSTIIEDKGKIAQYLTTIVDDHSELVTLLRAQGYPRESIELVEKFSAFRKRFAAMMDRADAILRIRAAERGGQWISFIDDEIKPFMREFNQFTDVFPEARRMLGDKLFDGVGMSDEVWEALQKAHNVTDLDAKWRILAEVDGLDPKIAKRFMQLGLAGELDDVVPIEGLRVAGGFSDLPFDRPLLALTGQLDRASLAKLHILTEGFPEARQAIIVSLRGKTSEEAAHALVVLTRADEAGELIPLLSKASHIDEVIKAADAGADLVKVSKLASALKVAGGALNVAGGVFDALSMAFAVYETYVTVPDLIDSTSSERLKEMYAQRYYIHKAEFVIGGIGLGSAAAGVAGVGTAIATPVAIATVPVTVGLGEAFLWQQWEEDVAHTGEDWMKKKDFAELVSDLSEWSSFEAGKQISKWALNDDTFYASMHRNFKLLDAGPLFRDPEMTEKEKRDLRLVRRDIENVNEEKIRAIVLHTTSVVMPTKIRKWYSESTYEDISIDHPDAAEEKRKYQQCLKVYIDAKVDYVATHADGPITAPFEGKSYEIAWIMRNAESYARHVHDQFLATGKKPVYDSAKTRDKRALAMEQAARSHRTNERRKKLVNILQIPFALKQIDKLDDALPVLIPQMEGLFAQHLRTYAEPALLEFQAQLLDVDFEKIGGGRDAKEVLLVYAKQDLEKEIEFQASRLTEMVLYEVSTGKGIDDLLDFLQKRDDRTGMSILYSSEVSVMSSYRTYHASRKARTGYLELEGMYEELARDGNRLGNIRALLRAQKQNSELYEHNEKLQSGIIPETNVHANPVVNARLKRAILRNKIRMEENRRFITAWDIDTTYETFKKEDEEEIREQFEQIQQRFGDGHIS